MSAIASQVIAATIEAGPIQPDERVGTSQTFARYLPFWAWVYLRWQLSAFAVMTIIYAKSIAYLFKRLSMTDSTFTESMVKEAALAWLKGLGWAFKHAPEIRLGELVAEQFMGTAR